jgi:hypothetical protein
MPSPRLLRHLRHRRRLHHLRLPPQSPTIVTVTKHFSDSGGCLFEMFVTQLITVYPSLN